MSAVRRGDIWLVCLDPTVGAEIKKTRPALIISNDIANQHSATVTLLPVSDRGVKVYPFEVEVSDGTAGLVKASKIKCQQVRTVDKSRLIRFLGAVSDPVLHAAERALCLHLGLDPATHGECNFRGHMT
jgi:mRNA interferase MazF